MASPSNLPRDSSPPAVDVLPSSSPNPSPLYSVSTGLDEGNGSVPSVQQQQHQQSSDEAPSSSSGGAPVQHHHHPSPLLLREWNYPPVAPAVVVGTTEDHNDNNNNAGTAAPDTDSHERSSTTTFSYPVATFVRGFVRTSMDQIYPPNNDNSNNNTGSAEDSTAAAAAAAAAAASQAQSQPPPAASTEETYPLSIRSEADVARFLHPSDNIPDHHTVSARTVNDIENEEAEFILVDGDLIALPPLPPNQREQELLEEHLRFEEGTGPNKACQPSRMRRGVRKIGKWLGRKKNKNQRASSRESQQFGELSALTPQVPPPYHTSAAMTGLSSAPASPTAAAGATAPSLSRQSSTGEGSEKAASPHRQRRRQRNKKRISWKQQHARDTTSESSAMSTVRSLDEAFFEGDGRVARRSNSLVLHDATTGLLSAAQLQLQHYQQHQAAAAGATAAGPPMAPAMAPFAGSGGDETRTQSVTATMVGTADSLPQAGVLPAESAEAFIEYYYDDEEKAKKQDEALPPSLVPTDVDYKVDKAEAPDVEYMLRRAAHETTTDLEASELQPPETLSTTQGRAKSDGSSVPLSRARSTDPLVHNDTLKVVLVGSPGVDKSALGRAIRQSTKRPRKRTTLGIDVHTWCPSPSQQQEQEQPGEVRFQIWDVQGATTTNSGLAEGNTSPNFGAHPGTQSVFFSSQSLYLLVWDLGMTNPHTHPPALDDESEDEEEYYENEYAREEAIKQADRALQEDIHNRVLSWVDTIARRAPKSAILPVAVIPDGLSEKEAQRRCDKMHELLEAHMQWYQGDVNAPNVVLDVAKNILCVNFTQGFGLQQLQETMVAIATDSSRSVFAHVGTPVPRGTVEVLELLRRVKQQHKLILVDHVLGELGTVLPVEDVTNALHFLSSIGEVLYYGTADDHVLSSFIILSRKWLVSALSCILRNDLKRELLETRRFMRIQSMYTEQTFQENEKIEALASGAASSCPLLSDDDAKMLWQSMSFMREAADRSSELSESSTNAPTMFYFLERLLIQYGIFLPLGGPGSNQMSATLHDDSRVFFVPSLLAKADPANIWTYKSSDSWTTTLCHSWLFRDGAPPELFEHVTVALLNDLYKFSRTFDGGLAKGQPQRIQTVPVGLAAKHKVLKDHDSQPIGPIRIHQAVCWKSALLLKIGTIFPDAKSDDLRESLVEIFVTIADQNSSHCVSSDAMRGRMQRIVVSGKGPSGHHGYKLFKGGYQVVLDSLQATLASINNVNMQVICPGCLAHGNPRRASTWGWDEVVAAAEEGSCSTIVCRRGHRIKSNLLCGTCKEECMATSALDSGHSVRVAKPVPEILPSVVLVGLWDPERNEIRNVGSGFVADRRLGLIVTAGHVLFDMTEGRSYGTPYFGLKDAKVVVGVIPDEGNNAVFRYFAEIVTDDVRNNVDACVLRLSTRMEKDAEDGASCASQPETLLDPTTMKDENLSKIRMETKFELEESVRILGFNQGGEGVLEPGRHVLRSADFARGYICRLFTADMSDDSSTSTDSSSKCTFTPREEIVAMCPTISGHSGGPCVNDDGNVVGILSRADPVDSNRCYLVPASQLKSLVKRARGLCSRPVYPTTRKPQLSKLSTM